MNIIVTITIVDYVRLERRGSVVVSTPAYHAACRGSSPRRATRHVVLGFTPGSIH